MTVVALARPRFGFAALLVAAALALSGCGVNAIPTLDEQVKAAWAQVQNQFQRRADLIPNLVETVKGYAGHERETLEAVVNARARATQTTLPPDILTNPEAFRQFQQNQQAISGALGRLLAITENYPDLKANENVLSLQENLTTTENQISFSRQHYNATVLDYNTGIATFPAVLIAGIFGFIKREFFDAEPEASAVPNVDLSLS